MSFPKENNAVMWHALDVEIEAEAREAVEYALMEAGALGTETKDSEDRALTVTGYFGGIPDRERVRAELAEALRIYELPSSSVLEMSVREVANEDWLGEWKKNWQPVGVGRFVVAPPWSEIPSSNDRIIIRIEPGMAFGTGTHETTRLCLAAIERYFEGGSFLDVGTGTGILAIAAARLFPGAQIDACDTDEEAVEIARENARLNEASDIVFHVGSVDDATPSADFVCANLTANVINDLIRSLLGVTCGRLVLSGILDIQVEDVLARIHECGVSTPIQTARDGEWAALII
ncbi:MAG: 50S ribosomal protein L11 methyltransferase [Acidobacteriota bacterium]